MLAPFRAQFESARFCSAMDAVMKCDLDGCFGGDFDELDCMSAASTCVGGSSLASFLPAKREGEDSTAGAPPGKKQKVAEGPKPCSCCGRLWPDMPPKSNLCWDHKRTVDVMTNAYRKADKEKGTKKLEAFNKLRSASGPVAPTKFSELVMEYERNNPGRGKGLKRSAADAVTLLDEHYAETAAQKGIHCVMMHHARWLRFAVESLVITAGDAEDEWIEALRSVKLFVY
jgi:hypothetical protein